MMEELDAEDHQRDERSEFREAAAPTSDNRHAVIDRSK